MEIDSNVFENVSLKCHMEEEKKIKKSSNSKSQWEAYERLAAGKKAELYNN